MWAEGEWGETVTRGKKKPTPAQQARGLLKELHAALEAQGDLTAKELGLLVGKKPREVYKLLDDDPTTFKADGFPTVYSRSIPVEVSR